MGRRPGRGVPERAQADAVPMADPRLRSTRQESRSPHPLPRQRRHRVVRQPGRSRPRRRVGLMAGAIEIVHTHAEGTIATGTRKGDGSAEILKANSWRWSRQLDAWYIPRSRDQLAKTWVIQATEEALTAAGFNVSV